MKLKFIEIHLKRLFRFWIYVKIRYEHFHCSVIVDNMKQDCVLLEKILKLQRVVYMLWRHVPSDLERTEKVRKLERYITQRSIPNTNRTFWSR